MSMVSYAAGSRYLSLIGGVCLSFYDWYCDLPPASPMVWGEQTDVPESPIGTILTISSLGVKRTANSYPRRSLLYRSALKAQNCRHHP